MTLVPRWKCSFCDASGEEGRRLFHTYSTVICSRCVGSVSGLPSATIDPLFSASGQCGFCLVSASETKLLYTKSSAQICMGCIELCQSVIVERDKT